MIHGKREKNKKKGHATKDNNNDNDANNRNNGGKGDQKGVSHIILGANLQI